MKKCLLGLLGSVFLMGCTSDDLTLKDTVLQFSSQKWLLVEMTGSMVNSSSTGEDMAWQEYYIFNPDGSFIKSRERDGTVLEATGTFEVVEFDNDEGDYLELSYTSGEELVGSCWSSELTELLRFDTDNILYNTWMACDGPGLYYELVN